VFWRRHNSCSCQDLKPGYSSAYPIQCTEYSAAKILTPDLPAYTSVSVLTLLLHNDLKIITKSVLKKWDWGFGLFVFEWRFGLYVIEWRFGLFVFEWRFGLYVIEWRFGLYVIEWRFGLYVIEWRFGLYVIEWRFGLYVIEWMFGLYVILHRNSWKASLKMVISIEILWKGISCSESCLTSSLGENGVTDITVRSQVTNVREEKNEEPVTSEVIKTGWSFS